MEDDDKFDVICNKAQLIANKIDDDIEEAVKDMTAMERSAFMSALSGHIDFKVIGKWYKHHPIPPRDGNKFQFRKS